MTDELVKRLRYLSRVFRKHDVEDLTDDDYLSAQLYPDEAADRIERLTAERDRMTALIKAVNRLEILLGSQARTAEFHSGQCECIGCAEDDILAAFAALKDNSHE